MNIGLLARKTLFSQPGGDTVQVVNTAEALQRYGHRTFIVKAGDALPEDLDLLHFFNIGRPADAMPYFVRFKGKKVISTIFVDYKKADKQRFPWLYSVIGSHGMEYIKTLARGLNKSDRWPEWSYLIRGQRKSMIHLLKHCDTIITSSMSELQRVSQWAKLPGKSLRDRHRLVPLGIDTVFIDQPRTEAPRTGLLMVGRLEYLKNQISVIRWAKAHDWPLTVVGDPNINQNEYYQRCLEEAGPLTRFLPFQNQSEVIQLMDEHKVFLVPSFFESYSLVAWEAAARGMAVIANRVPDMSETLEPIAEFANFDSEDEVIRVIQHELAQLNPRTKKSQAWFKNYTWDVIGQKIIEAYT